jgi:hypothetical protein
VESTRGKASDRAGVKIKEIYIKKNEEKGKIRQNEQQARAIIISL